MARTRIKKGILEFSTNSERSNLIKKYVIEVRCAVSNKLSHAYNILSVKRSLNDKR